jgi:hypothetical protein
MVLVLRLVDGVHHLGHAAEMEPDLPDDCCRWVWQPVRFCGQFAAI